MSKTQFIFLLIISVKCLFFKCSFFEMYKLFWLLSWCLFNVNLFSCMSSSCAPPTQCAVLMCHVTCSHPPQAWDSHHVVDVCQEVQFTQFVGEAVMIFQVFMSFVCHHLHPALLQFRECRPPSHCSRKPTCFIHRRTNTQKSTPTHLPHSRPQPSIAYIRTQPSHPLIQNPTQPLIPPSFFRFSLGWFNHQKAALRHPQHKMPLLFFSGHTLSFPHMKRTHKKKKRR